MWTFLSFARTRTYTRVWRRHRCCVCLSVCLFVSVCVCKKERKRERERERERERIKERERVSVCRWACIFVHMLTCVKGVRYYFEVEWSISYPSHYRNVKLSKSWNSDWKSAELNNAQSLFTQSWWSEFDRKFWFWSRNKFANWMECAFDIWNYWNEWFKFLKLKCGLTRLTDLTGRHI